MRLHVKRVRRALVPGPRGTTVAFVSKPIDEVKTADIEALRAWCRQE